MTILKSERSKPDHWIKTYVKSKADENEAIARRERLRLLDEATFNRLQPGALQALLSAIATDVDECDKDQGVTVKLKRISSNTYEKDDGVDVRRLVIQYGEDTRTINAYFDVIGAITPEEVLIYGLEVRNGVMVYQSHETTAMLDKNEVSREIVIALLES
jgi:hypothetical protein